MLDISLVGDHDEVKAGSALITYVQHHPGHAISYNRWYEEDHFYSGVVMGPWVLGGRRFVAPPRLKAMRYTTGEWPADKGTFLALYMIQDGHKADYLAWGGAQVAWLRERPERNYDHRDHVFGSTHDIRWCQSAGGTEFPAHLLPARNFPGLMMVVGDVADAASASDVDAWHRARLGELPPSPGMAVTVAFNPGSGTFVPAFPIEGTDRRFLHLHFLDSDPLEAGVTGFDSYREALEATGLAHVTYMSPFVPTEPGTTRHLEDL